MMAINLGLIIAIFFLQLVCFEADPFKCSIFLENGKTIKKCKRIPCGQECVNGSCNERTLKCECNPGYQMADESISNSSCSPVCDSPCAEHSQCAAPGKCKCNAGYEEAMGKCRPVCHQECRTNSYCGEPGKCLCEDGYVDYHGICVPFCHPACGEHSKCSAAGKCECDQGYREDEGACRPICTTACDRNAYCASPNNCQCLHGYFKVESVCQAICLNGCQPNASCMAPQQCECDAGFQLAENVCLPACKPSCAQNFTCVAPDHCECRKGFVLNEQGTCVAAACRSNINLLGEHVTTSCESAFFWLFAFYGTLVLVVVMSGLAISYGCQRWWLSSRSRSVDSGDDESPYLVVSYQPTEPGRQISHDTIRESLPPPYEFAALNEYKELIIRDGR